MFLRINESLILYRNVSLNDCNLDLASSDCVNGLNKQLDFYAHLLIIIFYTTATVNFFMKLISLFNFKYWLMHRVIFKSKSREDELCSQYNDSKSRLFRRQLESQIAENEKYWAENFLDLNLRSSDENNNNNNKPTGGKTLAADENRYLNVEMEYFLDEEEKRAIEMIDDAIKKPTTSPPLNRDSENEKKIFTFKPNKK